MRSLATIQKIKSIDAIEGADKIEYVSFEDIAWKVVSQKALYKPGELVIYCEIDSWIPHTIAPFLTEEGKEPKVYNGVSGQRLKTRKLRGVYSQGLILPTSTLKIQNLTQGMDVTDVLCITKWESSSDQEQNQVPQKRNAVLKFLMSFGIFRNTFGKLITNKKEDMGAFPAYMTKTDEERVQNLAKSYSKWANTSGWSVSEKLDGQSGSFGLVNTRHVFGTKKRFDVCSRNNWLKTPHNCNWWNVARELDIENKLKRVPFQVYIQGEICGGKIQGNPYKFSKLRFFVFNVVDVDTGHKYTNKEIEEFCKVYGFECVPYLGFDITLPDKIETLIEMADSQSRFGTMAREGIVVRQDNISFKVISNKFLEKQKDV